MIKTKNINHYGIGKRVSMKSSYAKKYSNILFNVKKRYIFVLEQLNNNDVVLDFGCGSGIGTQILGSRNNKIIGYDIDKEAIQVIKYKKNILFIDNLTQIKKKFDKIVCFEVLEHIPFSKHKNFIKNLFNMLEDGGELFFSTPISYGFTNNSNPTNPYHYCEYSFYQINLLLCKYGKINFFDAGESFGFQICNIGGDKITENKKILRSMRTFYLYLTSQRIKEGKYRLAFKYFLNLIYSNSFFKLLNLK